MKMMTMHRSPVKLFMRSGSWLFCALALLAGSARADGGENVAPVKLTFAQAIDRALSQNPSFALSAADVARAEALVAQAQAGANPLHPTVTANATATALDGARTLGDRVLVPQASFNANITLNVPLVSAQRWAQTWRATDMLNVTKANAADVRRQVAVAIGRSYLGVVAQHRLIAVNQVAYETAKAHYDYAHDRLTAGLGTKVDDLRAQQEVATSTAQLETAQAGLAKLQEALGVLLASDRPVDVSDDPSLSPPSSLSEALKDAPQKRSDLRALDTRIQTAHRAVGDAWTDYMPSVSLLVQPNTQLPATPTAPELGLQAQLVLSIPLYDGGLRAGQQKERSIIEDQARISLDTAVRQMSADVRASFESVRRNDASLKANRDAATAAHQTLDLTLAAYKAGAISNLEVIDAERRARDADSAVVIAEDNARQARLDLLAASGRFPE